MPSHPSNLPPEDRERLEHMLSHAVEAVAKAGSIDGDRLEQSRDLQLVLWKLIEIVGEAASRVSVDTQVALPQIEWAKIIGMRNHLVHGYVFVDWHIVAVTVCDNFPPLIDELKTILKP